MTGPWSNSISKVLAARVSFWDCLVCHHYSKRDEQVLVVLNKVYLSYTPLINRRYAKYWTRIYSRWGSLCRYWGWKRAPDVWRVEKIEILKNLVVNYHLLNTKTGQTVEGPGTFYGYDEIRQMLQGGRLWSTKLTLSPTTSPWQGLYNQFAHGKVSAASVSYLILPNYAWP